MFINQAAVLFSGYNPRAIISFCRCASELQVPFHILASSPQDPIIHSDYSDAVHLTRSNTGLTVDLAMGWLNGIRDQHNYEKLVVVPSTEYLNRFFLQHRQKFEAAGYIVPLVDMQLYLQISDKKSFAKLCSEHDLAVPQELDTLPQRLPFVAKPIQYLSEKKETQLRPWLITSDLMLKHFIETEEQDDFFYQEMVEGKSIYLLFYVSKNGDDVVFSQENLIQQRNGGSIIAAKQADAHLKPIAQQYLSMFKSLSYQGVLMVELKETENGYVMIEANPRLWGPIQFVIDNQVPILEEFLIECGFGFEKPESRRNPGNSIGQYYFWSGGMNHASQPYFFHNYREHQFQHDYPDFIKSDVYLRQDTINVYLHEIRDQT